MDLPTHFAFAFAVGLVFFGKPDVALLIALGALLPDLDREYWFIPKAVYADEQIHRAGLHNVFVMSMTYIVSPFFALGVFLHVLQDSFTTVKDRGVEWFYPVTRLAKRGLYDSNGKPQPIDPKEKVYFYQEDPEGLVNKADPDLREYGCEPIPWRRVYGFAQNSQILDKGFLFGSIAVIILWVIYPGGSSHFPVLINTPSINYLVVSIGLVSIGILFLAGELDRRVAFGKSNFVKYPMLGLGIALFITWLVLFLKDIVVNVNSIFSNPVSILVGVIILPIIVISVIKWKARGGQPAVI